MPQIPKPNTLNKIWAAGGDRATPLDGKISSGWQIEIPPRQWFNWLDNRQDQAIAHFNQHGIPVWDDQTEYQAGKSYVQDPGNGLVYRCVITNTGNQPALTPSHWTVAFADAATAFSESQADAKYLAKSSNLADVPNKNTARNNLSVYSRTEVESLITAAQLGVGQSWQNVTGSRAIGTTYTNTTGRPIYVSVGVNETGVTTWVMEVNGVQVGEFGVYEFGAGSFSTIVPAGSTYRVYRSTGAGGGIRYWSELR